MHNTTTIVMAVMWWILIVSNRINWTRIHYSSFYRKTGRTTPR